MRTFPFSIEKKIKGKLGRAGALTTAHGTIPTPAFAVVGTKATVKALTPSEVEGIGAQVVLGNTYHLYLEPGEDIVKQGGGLGRFMGWQGPTMTDSGGFQVFSLGAAFGKQVSKISRTRGEDRFSLHSLADGTAEDLNGKKLPLAKIDEDGVTFKSFKDGSEHRFTPERSIEIQQAIGADIIFAFDECTSPDASYEYQKLACARTHRWATRSLGRHRELKVESLKFKGKEKGTEQALFGIVQGGRFEELRKESARFMAGLCPPAGGFDGFGIGG